MTKNQRKNDTIKIHRIFGHKVLEDSFLFHLQWNNLICEWIDGSLLTKPDQETILINYWKTGGRLYLDRETQTYDIAMDDLNCMIEKKIKNELEMVSLSNNGPTKPYVYKVCVAIKDINAIENVAEVIFNTQEEEQMELKQLIDEYPTLVAQFYLQKASQNI